MTADLHQFNAMKNVGKARALLHALVPRAQCFCFYDGERQCVWSSDGAEDYEVDSFIEELPGAVLRGEQGGEPYLRRTLKSGRTIFSMPVLTANESALGRLVVVFSRNAGKSSAFNPSLLYDILKPAIDVVAEGLDTERRLQRALSDTRDSAKELRLVYEVDEKVHGSSHSHAGLAQLVGQSGRFLEIAYSVLLIPGKRIRISATHSSWKGVNRKVLDRYLIDHMMPKLDGRNYPVVFEIPASPEAGPEQDTGYQTLLCPIVDRHGNAEGVLALLGRVNNKHFEDSHRRFMAHIARKVELVIQQSFDTMTGVMNRGGFEAQMHESWKALEDDKDTHQLIYFDLDNLQLVNDKFGRNAGDEVIKRLAVLLEENLPQTAVLSRLGEDDFCILLTHANSDQAMALASGVRSSSDQLRYLQGDSSLQVTMSIGIAEFNRANGLDNGALTHARMACESAKEHGRDRVEVYDGDNQSMVRRYDDMNLVAVVQKALDSDGFDLMAQPILGLSEGDSAVRYEILLRMRETEGEDVPTESFLSTAERYQMMPQIDRWVVSTSLQLLAEHPEMLAERDARFSINLSGQSLSDDEMLDFIQQELDAAELPASCIGFEVTESAAVSNLKRAQHLIDTLHERGCRISLDDFGAGLSSFAYLKNFKVDALKIDGGFIRDITDNRISESMVAAITQVAKVMELETVAEYVESDEIRNLIERLGVDYAQGHAIGKPAPLADVLEQLEDLDRTWLA
ncbi:MAG: EAL domain-containing protein [Woeseiaceae bacterium]|nr:EAL domain-containing protein [Woeseiaceae bacterium]